MKRIALLLISQLTFANHIATESDLYSSYLSGEMDFNTYLQLNELMQHKSSVCTMLPQLSSIPDVTPEELDTLERLCAKEAASDTLIPPELLRKIAAFSEIEKEPGKLRSEYAYTKNIRDTVSTSNKEHSFRIRFNQGVFSAQSQGVSDGFGNGYFYRNGIEIKNFGRIRRLAVGSFRQSLGLGINFGGAPSTISKPVSASFTESLLSPTAKEPFGAYLALRFGAISPFALVSGTFADDSSKPGYRANAIGVTFSQKRFSLGAISVSSKVGSVPSNKAFASQSAGFYGSFHREHESISAEMAFCPNGYGGELKALKRMDSIDMGLTARKYSIGYANPMGKGTSAFSNRIITLHQDSDSISFYGIRSGEWGGEAYLGIRKAPFVIRPSVSIAESERFSAHKFILRLNESLQLAILKSTLASEQAYSHSTEQGDTTHSGRFLLSTETILSGKSSFRLKGVVQSDPLRPKNFYGKADVFFSPLSHLALSVGCFIFAPIRERSRPNTGLILEERFRLYRDGWIKISGVLDQADTGGIAANTLVLSCNFFLL